MGFEPQLAEILHEIKRRQSDSAEAIKSKVSTNNGIEEDSEAAGGGSNSSLDQPVDSKSTSSNMSASSSTISTVSIMSPRPTHNPPPPVPADWPMRHTVVVSASVTAAINRLATLALQKPVLLRPQSAVDLNGMNFVLYCSRHLFVEKICSRFLISATYRIYKSVSCRICPE